MRFIDVLNARQIAHKAHSFNPNEIYICCLFCADRGYTQDRRYRLSINLSNGKAHCFNCAWGSNGHAISAVMHRLRVFEELEGQDGLAQPKMPAPKLPSDFQPLTKLYDEFDNQALDYLKQRGITVRQVINKRIGVSYVGRYAFRIIFPVYVDNVLRGIVSRDFTGNREPRYLNSPGMKALYNLPEHAMTEVIISEGIFKALRIEQAIGTTCASITSLGASMSKEQVEQFRERKFKTVTIYPDPDAPGQFGAARAAQAILDTTGVRPYIALIDRRPADEATLEQIARALQRRVPYSPAMQTRMLMSQYL